MDKHDKIIMKKFLYLLLLLLVTACSETPKSAENNNKSKNTKKAFHTGTLFRIYYSENLFGIKKRYCFLIIPKAIFADKCRD